MNGLQDGVPPRPPSGTEWNFIQRANGETAPHVVKLAFAAPTGSSTSKVMSLTRSSTLSA